MKLRSTVTWIVASLAIGIVGCKSDALRLWPVGQLGQAEGNHFAKGSEPNNLEPNNLVPTSGNNAWAANKTDFPNDRSGGSNDQSSGSSPVLLASAIVQEDAELAPYMDNMVVEELPSQSENLQQPVTSENRFPEPVAGLFELPTEFYDLSLRQAIAMAMSDRMVLRSLSGAVIRNPTSVGSSLDPEIQSSNANFGLDAALSQFDPVLTARSTYANNDDFFNNPSTTGNAAEVQQDLTQLTVGLDKIGEHGTRFSLSPGITHDNTNNPSVFFSNSWESVLEATIQQPLLQGRGRQFNRIAGPNSQPGFFGTSGIEISRVDNQIEYSRFERGLREYVLELVNAYWQLHLAYENYHSIRGARDASFETWQIAKAKYENGLPGGEADREAQARGQHIQFEIQLDQALNAVRANQAAGVLQAEANLRRLMNLPQSGGALIRPTDHPCRELPNYDWDFIAQEALSCRAELLEQRQRVNKANLLAEAAKNFTLPRLDAIATYRLSGLGDDLIAGSGKFSGAINETLDTNFEEFEIGLSYELPVGQRRAAAGLRNARLQSTREQLLLEEMEQQIIHDLGTAYRSAYQTSHTIKLATLRRDAARDTFLARKAVYEADAVGFEDLLESQRIYLDAELALQTATTEREQAIYQLASNQGTLLEELDISVVE